MRIARQQHGLVTRRQLLARGVQARVIDRRIETGELQRIRRGIYVVGPLQTPLTRDLAAVLACGPTAHMSHHHAAALHKLLPHPAQTDPVHVTVTCAQPGCKPGIVIHRAKELPPDERTRRDRIPATSPARTILDLAPTFSDSALEQLVAQAHRKHLATADDILALAARYPRRPGTPALRALLTRPAGPKFTRSSPERRLLALIRKAGIDEPETNTVVGGFEVDFLWEDRKLIIEVDSQPFHAALPDRRRDHARDARLISLGYTVLRIDGDEVDRRPEAAVVFVARATG